MPREARKRRKIKREREKVLVLKYEIRKLEKLGRYESQSLYDTTPRGTVERSKKVT